MATFVLVHGAWHGSWCWKRVRNVLQRQSHEVFTPTLTGVGERTHLLSAEVNLETHIQDILNLIRWEELDDLVLCGHSYGGMVVSAVADRMPERIRSLLFVDAFVPETGQCLEDFAPTPAEQLVDGWKCRPISAQTFGVNLTDRAWVDAQCTLQSRACFSQRVQLTGGLGRVQRIAYVYAAGWAGDESPFFPFYEKARSRGWKTRRIDCGHDVMIDRPEALTQMLLEGI
jgi:pimeloyl-ACP methyl ester carboxylesterase